MMLGNIELALNNFIKATQIDSPPEMKIELFWNIGQLLELQADCENSKYHKAYTILIREEKTWKLNDEHSKFKNEQSEFFEKININEIKRKLEIYWKTHIDKTEERKFGDVINIVASGKAGFVKTEKGNLYFKIPREIKKISVGDKISFTTEKSIDPKTNKENEIAVNIKTIK